MIKNDNKKSKPIDLKKIKIKNTNRIKIRVVNNTQEKLNKQTIAYIKGLASMSMYNRLELSGLNSINLYELLEVLTLSIHSFFAKENNNLKQSNVRRFFINSSYEGKKKDKTDKYPRHVILVKIVNNQDFKIASMETYNKRFGNATKRRFSI